MARGQRVICMMIGLPTACTGDLYFDWPGYPAYKGAEPGRGRAPWDGVAATGWFCCVVSARNVLKRQRVSGFDLLAEGPRQGTIFLVGTPFIPGNRNQSELA